MFDFSDFYQLIAKNRLQSWLNVLPAQLTEWQNQPHGDLPKWMRVLKKIPVDAPAVVDIKDSVTIGTEDELPAGQRAKIENLLRSFHPWRKGPYTCTAFTLIQNGVQTGNGTAYCLISRR